MLSIFSTTTTIRNLATQVWFWLLFICWNDRKTQKKNKTKQNRPQYLWFIQMKWYQIELIIHSFPNGTPDFFLVFIMWLFKLCFVLLFHRRFMFSYDFKSRSFVCSSSLLTFLTSVKCQWILYRCTKQTCQTFIWFPFL